MTETAITVQGHHTERYAAEQADVHVTVSFDGPQRAGVFAQTNAASQTLRENIKGLFDEEAGPITRWSSDGLNVWGARPWNNDGKQHAIVFHAAIEFSARFGDFDALARFVEDCANSDGVTVGTLTWSLTDDNMKVAINEVRVKAVADQGMLGDSSDVTPSGGYQLASARSFKSADTGSPELSLKPEEIEVSAVVDVRFSAT